MVNDNQSASAGKDLREGSEQKKSWFQNTFLFLFIVGVIGLAIRLHYLPWELPLTLDAFLYFWYAIDISILGHLPTNFFIGNNGWPIFLSFFFYLFPFDNFYDYMLLQRLITVTLSTCTIIPVYLLCRKFFEKKYSLIGAAIFAFEPRIIQNSSFGITEPLYIIIGVIALVLFFSENRKLVYLSFLFVSLFTMIRIEGVFLFLTLSILFFMKFRIEKKTIIRYLFAVLIFSLILIPMAIIRSDVAGYDSLSSKFQSSAYQIDTMSQQIGISSFFLEGIINFFKFLGWSMIPIFIIFAPLGFILLLKFRTKDTYKIITMLIVLLLPALYAYTVKAFDTRYLYFVYPIFCILSIYTIRTIFTKFNIQKSFLILLTAGIIVLSFVFLEIKQQDVTHAKESLALAFHVVNNTKIINQYLPESSYLPMVGMSNLENFPVPSSEFNVQTKLSNCMNIHACDSIVSLNTNTLDEFIQRGKEKGLTHLVIDDSENSLRRLSFLMNVYNHEENYPFLIKEFDSKNFGFQYHLKIFRIDYDKWEALIKN